MEAGDRQTVVPDQYQGRLVQKAFVGLFAGTIALNLLALTGPLYALEIYDRVLPARSAATLLTFTVLALVFLLAFAALDLLRGQLISRLGLALSERVPEPGRSRLARLAMSAAPAHFLDLAFTPLYVALAFALHWILGATILLAVLALATVAQGLSRTPQDFLHPASESESPPTDAMGWGPRARWQEKRVEKDLLSSDRGQAFAARTKLVRVLAQSGTLGLSALLAINDHISIGTIMAMSVMTARVLAPIEGVITSWPSLHWALRVLCARRRSPAPLITRPQALPATMPGESGMFVERLHAARLGVTLSGISFKLARGDALGIIGPSASGKSLLLEALQGACDAHGILRLDGADLKSMTPSERERRTGYLKQTPAFLPGSVADVISRFDESPDPAALLEAAEGARLTSMIASLPHAFETKIDPTQLSPGLRQRLALARALYRTPDLVLLDDPFTHMDAEGDHAVIEAITNLRAKGSIVIIVSHRLAALEPVNLILALKDGRQKLLGPKDSALRLTPRDGFLMKRDAS